MKELSALICACKENLDDDLPRLVLADWLEENGDADRAAFIHLQCESAANLAKRVWVKGETYYDHEGKLAWDLLHANQHRWVGDLAPWWLPNQMPPPNLSDQDPTSFLTYIVVSFNIARLTIQNSPPHYHMHHKSLHGG